MIACEGPRADRSGTGAEMGTRGPERQNIKWRGQRKDSRRSAGNDNCNSMRRAESDGGGERLRASPG
jgi:hypothetical protein